MQNTVEIVTIPTKEELDRQISVAEAYNIKLGPTGRPTVEATEAFIKTYGLTFYKNINGFLAPNLNLYQETVKNWIVSIVLQKSPFSVTPENEVQYAFSEKEILDSISYIGRDRVDGRTHIFRHHIAMRNSNLKIRADKHTLAFKPNEVHEFVARNIMSRRNNDTQAKISRKNEVASRTVIESIANNLGLTMDSEEVSNGYIKIGKTAGFLIQSSKHYPDKVKVSGPTTTFLTASQTVELVVLLDRFEKENKI